LVAPFIISAIVYGCLFAFMAVGLTLTYLTTKVPNFAYGSFVTVGLYTSYTLFKIYHINPYLTGPVAFLVGGIASVIMYIAVLRPMARRRSTLLSMMIATFGVDFGFTGIYGIYTDYLQAKYGLSDAKQFFQFQADFRVAGVSGIAIVLPVLLAVITVGLYLLLSKTRFGVAMRASVENASLARIVGINVERVNLISWLLAGGFAGLAGAMYTLWLPGGTSTGSDLIVDIFAASVLGGLGSIFGAIVGGLAIGGSTILIGIDLTSGFGLIGTVAIALVLVLVGVLLFRSRKRIRGRILAGAFLAIGGYILADILLGYPASFLAQGMVSGFGPEAIEYQLGIPLVVMAATLLILPTGIVSISWRRLLGLEKKR
jgi:branched-chain amino acid transport system permease protein